MIKSKITILLLSTYLLATAFLATANAQTSDVKDAAFKEYCQTYQEDQTRQSDICADYWETPEYAEFYEKQFGFPPELVKYCSEERPNDAAQNATCYDYWTSLSVDTFDPNEERIESFDVEIVVNKDASIDVTEKITYFFPRPRHGIYRDIPVIYKTDSGGKVRLDLENVKVSTFSEESFESHEWQSVPFTNSRYGNYRRIKIGDPDLFVEGERTYVISYTVPRAVGFYENFDEIHWNVTGTEWQVPIRLASAFVTIPGEFSADDLELACYQGVSGDTTGCDGIGQLSAHKEPDGTVETTAAFTANDLSFYEGLTVAVGFPKGVVTEPTDKEKIGVWFDNFLQSGGWIFALPLLVFIFRYIQWSRKGRDPKGTGIITAQYDAPDGLSPMQTKFILSQSFGNSIAAEIIYLAEKGYLKIRRMEAQGVLGTEDYELEKREGEVELLPHQAYLLAALFSEGKMDVNDLVESLKALKELEGSNSSISNLVKKRVEKEVKAYESQERAEAEGKSVVRLSSLKDIFYKKAEKAQEKVTESLVEAGYFPETKPTGKAHISGKLASHKQRAIGIGIFLAVFGSFWLVPLSFGLGAYAGIYAWVSWMLTVGIWTFFSVIMPRLTPKGIAAREHVLGLRLYLSVAEKDRINFHNAPAKNPDTFEKYLPYAIALGVEKEWGKVFEGIQMPPPSWYGDPSYKGLSGFNAGAFASSMSSFSKASSSTLSSAPGSRSSGGGSSGSGGGGGGGGSW